jgi:DNA-binding LacI/PurR family transcriptional regulator
MFHHEARSGRLTIAVLLDYLNFFGGGYEAQLRDALHAKCRTEGHELLLLYGGALDGPHTLGTWDNAIFRILQPKVLDGIIVVSTLLGAYCGHEAVRQLAERYRPTPLCSIGIEMLGIPSIVLDNRAGMEAAVEHLVRAHGCRRLVFLAGTPQNPEAEARFCAYRDVLDRNGIAFDSDLVAPGLLRTNTGRMAMEGILARGVAFDGVVAANDEMAFGAIEALRKAGRRVPKDVPITGFDDLVLARLGNPPLTTVAQPFGLVANLAVNMIADGVAGRSVPACTLVPTQFIRRNSCGCGHQAARRGADSLPAIDAGIAEGVHTRLDRLRPALSGLLRVGSSDGSRPAARLLEGLFAEIAGEEEAFQKAVLDILEDVGDDNERHRMVPNAITFLRGGLGPALDSRMEQCFYDVLALAARSNTTTQVEHRLRLDENYLRLLTVGERASAFDLASLKEALAKGLPTAGVHTAFLSCVPDDTTTDLEPVLCLVSGVARESSAARFPASRLLAPGVIPPDHGTTFLVFPLTQESRLLGVVAFDYSQGTNTCAAFRNEIAAALKRVRLHQEPVQRTMLHERSVQERLATAKRMEALSVLAGGVAHDLNNALGPLVALPDVILDELDELKVGEETIRAFRSDIENIKAASLRAALTIKDLLTLGRQGRTAKENLDLNRVVESCVADSSLRFAKAGRSRAQLLVHTTEESLIIRGSESQLARAFGNLVRNGTEAIEGDGAVEIRTSSVYLRTVAVGYQASGRHGRESIRFAHHRYAPQRAAGRPAYFRRDSAFVSGSKSNRRQWPRADRAGRAGGQEWPPMARQTLHHGGLGAGRAASPSGKCDHPRPRGVFSRPERLWMPQAGALDGKAGGKDPRGNMPVRGHNL